MPIGVAFIRGINVGGKNALAMERLRTLCDGLGLAHATTYIQSGNVAFVASSKQLKSAAKRLEDAIEKACGFRPCVVARSIDDLQSVVQRGVFARRKGLDPAKALVMFLAGQPGKDAGARLKELPAKAGDVALDGRELYLYFEGGVSGSTLTMPAAERAVGVAGTCRNWKTLLKVLEIAERLGAMHDTTSS